MLTPGNILHVKDFEFSDGSTKDKFLISLCNHNGKQLVYTLPSSVSYVNAQDFVKGCTHTEFKHHYIFAADDSIGENGFSFTKDTYLYFQQLKLVSAESITEKYITTGKMELLDKLTDCEFENLVYCVYKGDRVTKRIKQMLEPVLQELTEKTSAS